MGRALFLLWNCVVLTINDVISWSNITVVSLEDLLDVSSIVLTFSVVIHMKKPLNYRCHLRSHWVIPVTCLHTLYVAALVGFTGAIRHIEFRFDEVRDLWRGIVISACSIGMLFSRFYKALYVYWYALWFKEEAFLFPMNLKALIYYLASLAESLKWSTEWPGN